VVAFGAPQVGDAEFTCFVASNVNMRRVAYVGSGQRNDVREERLFAYGIGDLVPLLPLACPNLLLPGESQFLLLPLPPLFVLCLWSYPFTNE
jgi:hypothetical protein